MPGGSPAPSPSLMAVYKVQVSTGQGALAGTFDTISITLAGIDGESTKHVLDQYGLDFQSGSVSVLGGSFCGGVWGRRGSSQEERSNGLRAWPRLRTPGFYSWLCPQRPVLVTQFPQKSNGREGPSIGI